MGLQNHLSDFSSDPFLTFFATTIYYLRSLLSTFLHSLNLFRPNSGDLNPNILFNSLGSGLAGIVFLADQINLNRVFSYELGSEPAGLDSGCVFCLNRFDEGDRVRKLQCLHVFHKECFDGWIDCFNFICPVCRTPLVEEEHMESTRRRVGEDLVGWFGFGW